MHPVPPSTPTFAPWRERLHEIIFEADTPAGKLFDVLLLIAIVLSVLAVMLETVPEIGDPAAGGRFGPQLDVLEWGFTVLFTVEYILRLICSRRPLRYATSFFGIVDLLSILPTYLAVLIPGAESMLIVRSLRLLRVFRVFKLARFVVEASALRRALWQSRAKIVVFLVTVLIIVTLMGTAMYLVEGHVNEQFESIPESVYWAVVTVTTVGYGDMTPQTVPGRSLAVVMMIIGYAMIIVPTGIVSAEFITMAQSEITTIACPDCTRHGHPSDAVYCKYCGGKL
jgi:voltage-gated potassium channel